MTRHSHGPAADPADIGYTSPLTYFDRERAFLNGEDTPRQFLERCLERISLHDPVIRGFTCLDVDRARRAADEATQRWCEGRALSPIDGMPVGIKDLFETEGMPTEGNSRAFRGFIPARDAACVAALSDFGAYPIGKTTTGELGGGEAPPTVNPRDVTRTPGGSSSGSAAVVAAGMIPAAIGTQLKGSLLRPASYCGAYALKPSFGSINRSGGITGASSATTIGTIANCLEDAWMLTQLLSRSAGPDVGHHAISGLIGLPEASRPSRIGILRPGGWPKTSEETRKNFDDILGRLGKSGVSLLEGETHPTLRQVEELCMSADTTHSRICRYEGRWPLRGYIAKDLVSKQLRQLATSEDWMTAEDYGAALTEREAARRLFDACLDDIDMLIGLTAEGPAPQGLIHTGDRSLQVLASYLGAPAFSLPLMTVDGMPVGVQVIGKLHDDTRLAAYARFICFALGSEA